MRVCVRACVCESELFTTSNNSIENKTGRVSAVSIFFFFFRTFPVVILLLLLLLIVLYYRANFFSIQLKLLFFPSAELELFYSLESLYRQQHNAANDDDNDNDESRRTAIG